MGDPVIQLVAIEIIFQALRSILLGILLPGLSLRPFQCHIDVDIPFQFQPELLPPCDALLLFAGHRDRFYLPVFCLCQLIGPFSASIPGFIGACILIGAIPRIIVFYFHIFFGPLEAPGLRQDIINLAAFYHPSQPHVPYQQAVCGSAAFMDGRICRHFILHGIPAPPLGQDDFLFNDGIRAGHPYRGIEPVALVVVQPAFVGEVEGSVLSPLGWHHICIVLQPFDAGFPDIRQIPANHCIQFPAFPLCYGNAVRKAAAQRHAPVDPFFVQQVILFPIHFLRFQAKAFQYAVPFYRHQQYLRTAHPVHQRHDTPTGTLLVIHAERIIQYIPGDNSIFLRVHPAAVFSNVFIQGIVAVYY
ncbi:hypothetical protein IMSAGC002_03126 [Lachnospiraceae bacterium]|nr:hypothetical protein IMSAGC002_03126 [Lachnospiraceae bacterium]